MVIRVNRAPVMTLWAAVVAEHLGFDEDEALTIGKTVAGLNAQAKGVRLGIYTPDPDRLMKERKKRPTAEVLHVDVLHRAVPVVRTKEGLRALSRDKPVSPDSVRRYLASKFKDELPAVKAAMEDLAGAFSHHELAANGYGLYEAFRPAIPAGVKGWGAAGDLDLAKLRALAPR